MLIRDRPVVGFTGGASDQIKISWQFVTRPDWSGEQRMHIWSQCYTSHLGHEMQKHAQLSHQISHLSWINQAVPNDHLGGRWSSEPERWSGSGSLEFRRHANGIKRHGELISHREHDWERVWQSGNAGERQRGRMQMGSLWESQLGGR